MIANQRLQAPAELIALDPGDAADHTPDRHNLAHGAWSARKARRDARRQQVWGCFSWRGVARARSRVHPVSHRLARPPGFAVIVSGDTVEVRALPLHERAALELKELARQSAADPRPSQRYEPDAAFAWAQRETKRQAQRRKWEGLLP